MKLKERIPFYSEGNNVTIINDIYGYHRNISSLSAGVDERMNRYSGNVVTITRVIRTSEHSSNMRYMINADGEEFNWSPDMFKESYTYDESLEIQEELIVPDKPIIGKYLFSGLHSSILFKVTDYVTQEDNSIIVTLKYFRQDRKRFIKDIYDRSGEDVLHNTFINLGETTTVTFTPSIKNNRIYYDKYYFIPLNDYLKADWGVTNIEDESNSLKLPIPNIFKDYKYPIFKYKFILEDKSKKEKVKSESRRVSRDERGTFRFVSPYETIVKHDVKEEFCFRIDKENKILVGYDGNKLITYKPISIINSNGLYTNDIKTIIKTWAKCRIKSCEKSIELFGFANLKTTMFNSIIGLNKDGKEVKSTFKINNVIFNFEKEGQFYHVVEVYNKESGKNIKFLLDDIELILPSVNGYNTPVDRTIRVSNDCKIIKDKLLPIKKDSVVKVVKIFNRHRPLNGLMSTDGNSIAVVVDIKTNKQFECKVKQLKKYDNKETTSKKATEVIELPF